MHRTDTRPPLRAAVAALALLAATTPAVRASWIPAFSQDFSSEAGMDRWSYSGAQLGGEDLFRIEGDELRATWDAGAGLDRPDIVTSHFSASLGLTLGAGDTFRVRAQLRLDALNDREFYQIANFGLFNPSNMGHNRTYIDGWGDARNLAEFNYWITPNDPDDDWANGAQIGPIVISGDDVWAVSGNDTELGEATLPTGTALYAELHYDGVTRLARATLYANDGYTDILLINGTPMQEWTGALLAGEDFQLTHVGFFNYVAADNWGYGDPLDGVGGEGAFLNVQVDYIPEPGTTAVLAAGLAVVALLRGRRHRRPRNG